MHYFFHASINSTVIISVTTAYKKREVTFFAVIFSEAYDIYFHYIPRNPLPSSFRRKKSANENVY